MSTQVNLAIGAKFHNFEEWNNFVEKYQNQEKQLFTIKCSKLLSNCKVKKATNESLKYYSISYGCKFGNPRKPESRGLRDSRTFKSGCLAYIYIAVSKDRQTLEIKKFNTIHTAHDGSEAYFAHLPENRRLNQEAKATAMELLKLRSDKKFIQDKLTTDYSQVLYQKDLHNLASNLKNADDDQLPKAVSILRNDYEADVSILHQENEFQGLYFSTAEMRKTMTSWPDIVFIDGTYKLFRRNFTLMILLVEDSDGASRIAGAGILASEDRPTLKWFIECFKKENLTACSRMQCMMGDKDLVERDVIREVFPGIPIYICIFHTLRTFNREVSTNKMEITLQERNVSLRLLDRLTKSTSQEDYAQTYSEFCQTVPESVLRYYNKNWHPIKEEWVKCNITRGNLGNSTNNRLESINSKLKQVVRRNSSMVDFFNSFFKWLNNRDNEMYHKRVQNILKKDVQVYAEGSVEQQYKKLLTKYAFSIIIKEIRKHCAITVKEMNTESNECLVKFQKTTIKVTDLSCECSTWKSMSLPCRHIFALRKNLGLPLFEEQLCTARWTQKYNLQTDKIKRSVRSESVKVSGSQIVNEIARPRNETTSQKRKLLIRITNNIIQVASQFSNARFQNKLDTLKEILIQWQQGNDVSLIGISSHNETHQSEDCKALEQNISEPSTSNVDSELHTSIANMSIHEESNIHIPAPLNSPQVKTCISELNRLNFGEPVKITGRPKGAATMAIGLPKATRRAIAFKEKTETQKMTMILKLLVPDDFAENAVNGEYEIQLNDVQHLTPATLTDTLMDDLVDLRIVRRCFTTEAFAELSSLVLRKKEIGSFSCGKCNRGIAEQKCVICDGCLLWHHFRCLGLKRVPKKASWFCAKCSGTH